MGEHRVVEHTADVGVTAAAETIERLFEQATLGLLEISGATCDPDTATEDVAIEVEGGRDVGALLVDWLSEVLYIQDARDRLIGAVEVTEVTNDSVRGRVSTAPRDRPIEGTAVKAVTYHQLVVEERDGVFTAQVFFDI